ncbi:MAG: class I SAM-dependent methyltransferase [Chloroflexi bacterium]|nr:class I SAM-dependent methyltransferase [Chloroflexota bacterium]MBT4073185.1 class I SAM-dependent methyltransferase [Chloroflexota bacterium]MBT4515081.1 class I SAM-dependent methyltransferase [Chloroflexota bacterium]MBT6681808.1 class I SAM-dependent methyltransferase [Chloroflexota bacterium]
MSSTLRESNMDQARAEAFGDRMVETLNAGSLALMTSIGHRTGLLDTMAGLTPSTSQQIADTSGMNERYVREWLGAMVAARVIEYQPDDGKYSLPEEHAAFLTRDAAPDNVAAFLQYIPLLGSVEDSIIECFKNGGGVPYAEFPRFQEVMAEDSGQTVVPALLSHIVPLVPGLQDALTKGIDVLDVGCGSGRALNIMALEYPNSRFTGFDLSDEATAIGRCQAEENGVTNLVFEARDVTKLGTPKQYDLITAFDAIHDQANPASVLAGISDALKDDGVFLMQDIAASSELHENIDNTIGTFLYAISVMHCMTVSLALDGTGLGTMWGEATAREMLSDAGLSRVDVNRLDHDLQNAYYIARK